jgi:hypothetical protein
MAQNKNKENTEKRNVTGEEGFANIVEILQKKERKELIIPPTNKLPTTEQCWRILKQIATSYEISETTAFCGIAMMFLQGAASKGVPPSFNVEVYNAEPNLP